MKKALINLIVFNLFLFFFLCLNGYAVTLATERIGYVDIDKVYAECPEVKLKQEEKKAEIEKRNKIINNKKEELEKQKTEYQNLKSSFTAEVKRYEEEKKKYDEFVVNLNKPVIPEIISSTGSAAIGINSDTTTVTNENNSIVVSSDSIPVAQIEPNLPRLPAISETDLKKVEENIKSLEDDINSQETNYQENLKNYDNAVLYNIYGKIYEIIKEVAEENGYTIVLDKGAVFFCLKESDITELVIEKLKAK